MVRLRNCGMRGMLLALLCMGGAVLAVGDGDTSMPP